MVKWLVAQGVDVRAARRGLELAQWALYGANSDALEFVVGYGGLPELNCRQTVPTTILALVTFHSR